MAIIFSDGFDHYKPEPPPENSVRATSYLTEIAIQLGLDFIIKSPYMVFNNEQDFTTIQFYV